MKVDKAILDYLNSLFPNHPQYIDRIVGCTLPALGNVSIEEYLETTSEEKVVHVLGVLKRIY